MLRRFGNLIWKQSRDISVMNYPTHLVYEVYTNQGYFYISQNKANDKLEVIENVIPIKNSKNYEFETDKSQAVFVSTTK